MKQSIIPQTILLLTMLTLLLPKESSSQQRSKAQEEMERQRVLAKTSSIQDRGGGTHNKSNIGNFFENRGKLYPRTRAQGVSGEFPIGSGREYNYRINPMVGIPGNVIQGRYTTNEEWEAATGYHNRDSARIAFSDKPFSWHSSGWPVKDANGNPVFISDQDSYCVYNDSNNTRAILGLQVNQIGYAWNLKLVQNMILFTYHIINKSNRRYDSLYFGMYCDIDVGNVSGGVAEYEDDRLGLSKELDLIYFYDSKGVSTEWPGGPTGYFGFMFITTPRVNGVQLGLTDMHYNLYDDDLDRDSVQYGILSSSPSLYGSNLRPRFFHLGSNAPNLHFDDTATVPTTGLDIVGNAGSGPYSIGPGDTLTFVTALVAGNTRADILANAQRAKDLVARNYANPRPPSPPKLSVVAGDKKVYLSWDNAAELSRDQITGAYDFEGYRLYKSIDLGQHWDQIDRNQQPSIGPDPVPFATFDKVNGLGSDNGLQYSFVDSSVTNGFEYWYSVTSYDRGDSLVPSLETARGNNTEAPNLGIATPRSSASGRLPVSITQFRQTGSGVSNVEFTVRPNDVPESADKSYDVRIEPIARIEQGNLRTLVVVQTDSSVATTANTFSIAFTSPTRYRLRDLTRNVVLSASANYLSDSLYRVSGLRVTLRDTARSADQRPEAGDSIVVGPGLAVNVNGAEVLPPQRIGFGINYATTNGVVVSLARTNSLKSITQTSGANPLTVRATITNLDSIPDQQYVLKVDSTFRDTSRSIHYLKVSLRDNANVIVARRDSLASGGTISGKGFTLNVSFAASSVPTVGSTVQIATVAQRPLTYNDKFAFTTIGARTDARKIAAELDRVKVVPNPYLISSQFEREFGSLRREPIRQLKFNNLPPRCTIHIFTLDGDNIKTLQHDSDNGTATWDMRGEGGREIAPGIYLYLVKTDTAERLSRFAVIK